MSLYKMFDCCRDAVTKLSRMDNELCEMLQGNNDFYLEQGDVENQDTPDGWFTLACLIHFSVRHKRSGTRGLAPKVANAFVAYDLASEEGPAAAIGTSVAIVGWSPIKDNYWSLDQLSLKSDNLFVLDGVLLHWRQEGEMGGSAALMGHRESARFYMVSLEKFVSPQSLRDFVVRPLTEMLRDGRAANEALARVPAVRLRAEGGAIRAEPGTEKDAAPSQRSASLLPAG